MTTSRPSRVKPFPVSNQDIEFVPQKRKTPARGDARRRFQRSPNRYYHLGAFSSQRQKTGQRKGRKTQQPNQREYAGCFGQSRWFLGCRSRSRLGLSLRLRSRGWLWSCFGLRSWRRLRLSLRLRSRRRLGLGSRLELSRQRN